MRRVAAGGLEDRAARRRRPRRVNAQLERVGQRFEWGDLTADEYRQKREWLLAQLAEVQTPAPASPLRLSGLLDAWDRTDALGKRELLAALFVELDMRDGSVWRVHPQPDVAAELWAHLREWRSRPPADVPDDGFGGSSPGGLWFQDIVHRCRKT